MVTVVIPLCLMGCRNAAVSGSDAGVASIEVVRTWRDLLDQPAISVGDCTARVGIEALKAPRNSGVLLYCLTEGYSLPEKGYAGDPLGPLTIRIRHENERQKESGVQVAAKWADAEDIRNSVALFRLSIPLPARACITSSCCRQKASCLRQRN